MEELGFGFLLSSRRDTRVHAMREKMKRTFVVF